MKPASLYSVLLLALCGQAAAAPGSEGADPLQDLLVQRGLVERVGDARQHVTEAASNLVVTALGFLGVPYKRGGNSFDSGLDCSGFVKAIYQEALGHVLPRRAAEQAQSTREIHASELKPGDLVFFNTLRSAFSHVGIYVGEGKFIHSPRPGAHVRLEDMGKQYWASRFNGARRVDSNRVASPAPTDNWVLSQ